MILFLEYIKKSWLGYKQSELCFGQKMLINASYRRMAPNIVDLPTYLTFWLAFRLEFFYLFYEISPPGIFAKSKKKINL